MLAAKICRYGKAWSWVFIGTLLLTMKSASGQSFRPLHAPDHAHQLAHLVLQVSSQPHPLGENLDALSSDIQRALELMQVEGLAHAQSASVPEVKLETIQASLSTKERGFLYLRSEAVSSSPNEFHIFYRHKDKKQGKAYVEAVLTLLKERAFTAFPRKVSGSEVSPESPVVLAFNFITSEETYPKDKETMVGEATRSPFGFHNEAKCVSASEGEVPFQIQEYFVPTFPVQHWEAVTPAQVAEIVEINNQYGSAAALRASFSQSFGTTMAYLERYLRVSVPEFLSSTKKLLITLADSQKLSRNHLKQSFTPAPTDYYVMASGLRPTFHSISGRNMAFLSYDFDPESYARWLILSQRIQLSSTPMLIEDCGWPVNMTDDFRKTVHAWWEQMSAIGSDQEAFQQTKFLCNP